MTSQSFHQILPFVRHPSRYLGSEFNAVRKDLSNVRLRFALAFPDVYEIGMSHVGLQILYHILNARGEVAAERVYAPGLDLEAELRRRGISLCSLETGTPLSRFDIVGFSLLYELNYTNILNILELSGIPFYARERDGSYPLIIAGGPCAFNPEPLADFFEAIVVGDGELVVTELADSWLRWRESGQDRQRLLETWAGIEGVYVPSLFQPRTDRDGLRILNSPAPPYRVVRKALVPDVDKVPYPTCPVVPFSNPIHDRLSVEICRGCTRGCRFCQAGIIYRPVRERAPEAVLDLIDRALLSTGYEDVSLLSLSAGDYGAIEALVERLMGRCASERIAVSLPSLRVGSLTPTLMTQIKRVRKTGFTIAPEAGSDRLRQVINKNITEEDLEKTVRDAFNLGWRLIKLYFMIGLPTETDADLDAIVSLVRRLKRVGPRTGGAGQINVSVSTFIPKSHTPFQWCSQISVAESWDKIRSLQDRLKGPGLRLKWQDPRMSRLEGLWARGDRALGGALVRAFKMGCRFDGWSDHFDYERWVAAIEASGVDWDFYTVRTRQPAEPLPWDHIDSRVSKEYLELEYKRALSQTPTQDCRRGECNQCGVCDFESVQPVTFEAPPASSWMIGPVSETEEEAFRKLEITYSKFGPARYFGHLELVKLFLRAFRRARIPVRYSAGFHPTPKVSFDSALPVGLESAAEYLTVQVPVSLNPAAVAAGLNEHLPDGLAVTMCAPAGERRKSEAPQAIPYSVTLTEGSFSQDRLKDFEEQGQCVYSKESCKGRVRIVDLKNAVTYMRILSSRVLELSLDGDGGSGIRPSDVLAHVFGLPETTIRLARVVKRSKGKYG